MRALLLGLLGLPLIAFAAEQAPQLDVRYLDEMENTDDWKSLASDGVSASVHDAKGVEGNALVLEYDLNKTAGYAAATRELPVTLPEDYEISFWMRGEAGRNNFEMKFVDASGDNVWWFRRANFQVSGDWQQIRIKRRQVEFAWGPTNDRDAQIVRRASNSSSPRARTAAKATCGSIDSRSSPSNAALKPPNPPQAHRLKTEPTSRRASSMAKRAPHGRAMRAATIKHCSWICSTCRSSAAWKSIGRRSCMRSVTRSSCPPTARPGTRFAVSKPAMAAGIRICCPNRRRRFIRLSMPKPGRAVGISELYVRDLQFGASPNAFIESLAKNAKRGCYPRAYSNEQTYWTIVGVDGDSEESMLSEDGALEVRKGSFSIEPFIRVRDKWLTWADMSIRHSLADGLSADTERGVETFRCGVVDDGIWRR